MNPLKKISAYIIFSGFISLVMVMLAVNVQAASFLDKIPFMASKQRIVMISHGSDNNTWWKTVENAANVAADQMDVKLEYRNPATGDLDDMARIIRSAADSKPDGIIVTIADFNKLSEAIKYVSSKNIPLVTINSGTPAQSKKLGALLHIGQPEYEAGLAAGLRAKNETNVNRFLCVNHEIDNDALTQRCEGFSKGLGVSLNDQMIDTGPEQDVIKQRVKDYLQKNPDTKLMLAVGGAVADPMIAAVTELELAGKVKIVTFDYSDKVGKAIKENVVSFAIDQQQFLQGHLSVVTLANLNRYGVVPGSDINSGPGFIHRGNLTLVQRYSGEFR